MRRVNKREAVKYTLFFMLCGLLLSILFKQIGQFSTLPYWFSIPFMLGQIMLFILVGYFIYLLCSKATDEELIRLVEGLILYIAATLGIAFAMKAIIEELQLALGLTPLRLINMSLWYGGLLISSMGVLVLQASSKSKIDVRERTQWNTPKVADGFFLIMFITVYAVFTLTTSKIITIYPRDYWSILHMIIVSFFLIVTWYHTRIYWFQRKLFLYVLVGFFLYFLVQIGDFLLTGVPNLLQLFRRFDQPVTNLIVAGVMGSIVLIVLFVWLVWNIYCEKNVFQDHKRQDMI